MSSSDFEDFEQCDAGAADCVPVQAGSVKKGGYILLKTNPCKVIDYATAKPGKHGAAKVHFVGIDIFTNKKYEDAFPTSATVWVPIVKKVEYEVADLGEDNFVSLILPDSTLKEDLKLPADAELHQELRSCWEENNDNCQVFFTVLSACGEEKIICARTKDL